MYLYKKMSLLDLLTWKNEQGALFLLQAKKVVNMVVIFNKVYFISLSCFFKCKTIKQVHLTHSATNIKNRPSKNCFEDDNKWDVDSVDAEIISTVIQRHISRFITVNSAVKYKSFGWKSFHRVNILVCLKFGLKESILYIAVYSFKYFIFRNT